MDTDKVDSIDIENLSEKEWREFKFNSEQLSVIDKKASSLLTVNALLIGLSTLSFVLQKGLPPLILLLSVLAVILLLISVFFLLMTVMIRWSTQLESREKIVPLRNKKELQLETSIYLLFAALVDFGLVFAFTAFEIRFG